MATAAAAQQRKRQQASSNSMQAGASLEVQQQQHETASLLDKAGNSNRRAAATGTSSNGQSESSLLDSLSHPLVVPSERAFHALLLAPLLVWWLAVLAGAWSYRGLPKGQRVAHGMMWFDKGVLRPAGGLVPFVVLLLRAAVHAGAHVWRRQRNPQHARWATQAQAQARGWPQLGSLVLSCLVVYAGMAVARIAIYLTHYFLLSRRYLEFHLVSDHIFLAATMLICLHSELVCLHSDVVRHAQEGAAAAAAAAAAGRGGSSDRSQQQPPGSWQGLALTLLALVALLLYVFTAADMYYTAKYYHFPLESLATTVLVFVMFQGPMVLWLTRQRQRC